MFCLSDYNLHHIRSRLGDVLAPNSCKKIDRQASFQCDAVLLAVVVDKNNGLRKRSARHRDKETDRPASWPPDPNVCLSSRPPHLYMYTCFASDSNIHLCIMYVWISLDLIIIINFRRLHFTAKDQELREKCGVFFLVLFCTIFSKWLVSLSFSVQFWCLFLGAPANRDTSESDVWVHFVETHYLRLSSWVLARGFIQKYGIRNLPKKKPIYILNFECDVAFSWITPRRFSHFIFFLARKNNIRFRNMFAFSKCKQTSAHQQRSNRIARRRKIKQ